MAAVAERDAVIAALLVRIEVLERRVGMDSSNSSMPPGSDGWRLGPGGAKTAQVQAVAETAAVGQPGHEGRGLQRVAVPDLVGC